MGEKSNMYSVLVGKLDGKSQLRKQDVVWIIVLK
jgi:hypothetical protein